ncbi:MAG: D-sedoheptulose 7-phosphate isomerase [Cytophagaceae bacterium]
MPDYKDLIHAELSSSAKVLQDFMADKANIVAIEEAALLMAEAIKGGGKILSCGNGGSSCDAMHFAEELTGRYRENRIPIPAISISDPSHITCTANDYGFDHIFSRYIKALGKPGDVLLAISTSGNSENIVQAVKEAKENSLKTIVLTGKNGGKLSGLSDLSIHVPHEGYADRIQELHIKIIHILILLLEKQLT